MDKRSRAEEPVSRTGAPGGSSPWWWLRPGTAAGGWGSPRGYGIAMVVTAASFALKLALAELAGADVPFLFFPISVLLSAWLGGLGPGLFSTVLSVFATAYFFIAPSRSIHIGSDGFFQVCLFFLESLIFCWLAYVIHHDRRIVVRTRDALARELEERRRTKDALRESEARFRTMADQAPVMIWLAGLDKGCTYVNRPWMTFTGRSLQENLGSGWTSMIHPDDVQHLLDVYAAAFDAREDFEVECRLLRADDEYRWILTRGTPRYQAGSQFTGYIGSAIDVTERREAEEEAARHAWQHATVARLGQEALSGMDLDVLLDEASRSACEALNVEYCSVAELLPDGSTLLLRSGTGWKAEHIGHTTLQADAGTHADYALSRRSPVVIADLLAETRFACPPLLFEHGVVSGISVVIPTRERPFGMLGAYTTRRRAFTPEDVAFLQAVSHVIAAAAERNRAERRLRESELRYRTLFNNPSDVVLVYHLNPDGTPTTYVEVNDVACRRLGYTREELLKLTPGDIADPSAVSLPEALKRLRASGTLVIESRHVTKTGEHIPVEVSAHLFELEGKPTIISVCRDITDRKRGDIERAELLEKERAAREIAQAAEQRALFLAQAGEVLASSFEYQSTIRTVANLMVPALADLCTITLKGSDGTLQPIAFKHVDPDRAALAREVQEKYAPVMERIAGVAHVIRTGRTEFYPEITGEMIERAAQDETHAQMLREVGIRSVIIVPLQARGSTLGAMTLIWSDTDRRYTDADVRFAEDLARRAAIAVDNARLYKEAREAERRAEEMARLKSAFLANMSHEIRTPLQGVLGFASLLSRQVTGKQHEYAERIMSSGHRLMDTLNAVLTLAKLEARQTDLAQEPVDVDAETREIVHNFQRRAEEKGLELRYIVLPGAAGATARLDAGGLSSVLHNVIGNAIKFTERGSVTVTLSRGPTQTQDPTDSVWIRVEDTGIGISSEFLPVLFDAFQQESTGFSRSHEGSGLGLSITKRLMDMMGGTISVESEKGKGSTFTITFPASGDARPPAQPAEAANVQLDDTRKARLLLVEDNEDARDFISVLLEDACDVTAAATGEEALAIAEAHTTSDAPFDLVLLDVNLGHGLSGVDVARALRKLPAFEHTLIVALTAYALPGDRERFLDAGFSDYISKPFTADELLERTSQLLAR